MNQEIKKLNQEIKEFNKENEKLNKENNKLKQENDELKQKIADLNRDNDELKKLLGRDSERNTEDKTASNTVDTDISNNSEMSKEITMYASLPRSAGGKIYFSDLTKIQEDDSYFELKISESSDQAVFKPLDFMKIRNYDEAMAAMITEGVKPNVASIVLAIESGKAHCDGKDWFIDNPAIIKLA